MGDNGGVIGGVIGAVIGGFVTGWVNPQGYATGWAIGSAIGGAYSASQQVIPGPKIGDVQKQTSQEGGFRPIVYGRSIPMSGNVLADGGPVIVTRRERQGKGGPKVESESAYRTYAVGFCEGEATLLQAWRNGILVYDTEDPSMAPENAKFLEYATWYTGTFNQVASPDLETIYGAGNAPYFRGTAYLSIHEEDVTDQRGAWSQWQVRVFRGASKKVTTPPYPLEYSEDLFLSPALPDMLLGDVLVSTETEELVSLAPSLPAMTLRATRKEFDAETEHVEVTPSLSAMTLRIARKEFDSETEHVAVTPSLPAMRLDVTRIDADAGTEHVAVTPSLAGVSLYVP